MAATESGVRLDSPSPVLHAHSHTPVTPHIRSCSLLSLPLSLCAPLRARPHRPHVQASVSGTFASAANHTATATAPGSGLFSAARSLT